MEDFARGFVRKLPTMPTVVPFGKYRGQPCPAAFLADPEYLFWCLGQEELVRRYPWLRTIVTGEVLEKGPEHNRLQVKFLDQQFVLGFVAQPEGVDVSVKFEVPADVWTGHSGAADVELYVKKTDLRLRVRIKPVMGDEYMAVLREMRTSGCNVLYLVKYTGIGATFRQMVEMFWRDNIVVSQYGVEQTDGVQANES